MKLHHAKIHVESSARRNTARRNKFEIRAGRLDDFVSKSNATGTMVAVLGDLHLQPSEMPLFHQARDQFNALAASSPHLPRIVQLGDLAANKAFPGTNLCFSTADSYLRSFRAPSLLVLGNHDLEGYTFDSDAENLAAWRESFQQPHHWVTEVGRVVLLGMSTVRFREAEHSVHEVFIDDEQIAWFEEQLKKYKDRPVVVFTHAPPMGCGLRVIQELHVKNRCCWLNHSHRPERFIETVRRAGNVKVWFSGHFHLSHNYADSISVSAGCAFVQTGVIGKCGRDGMRQSRVLKFTDESYQVYTMDHDANQEDGASLLRLDLEHAWDATTDPVPIIPEDEILCDPEKGWMCQPELICNLSEDVSAVQWLPVSETTMLAIQEDVITEFNVPYKAAIGVVTLEVLGRKVRLVNGQGDDITDKDGCGMEAVAIELVNEDGTIAERIPRNSEGGFFRYYQPNKWPKYRKEHLDRAVKAEMVAA